MLDTWFSSWLVPFSSLGWPDQTADLAGVLSRAHARHRARDPLLLGGADDHGRACEFMGDVPFTHRLPARHRARHPASQDVQVARQRHRSARGGGALRRRRAALHARVRACRSGTDVILDPDDLETLVRAGPELRQQAVERRAVHPVEPRRPAPAARRARPNARAARRADAGRPLDHRALRRHRPRGDRGVREVPAQRCGRGGLPLPLERSRRLVHRADQAAALRRRARRRRGARRRGSRRSTWRSACSTRSCRSSPRRSGGGSRAAGRTRRSRWRLARARRAGRGRRRRSREFGAGAGAGRRDPRHPRRVRRAARADGARRSCSQDGRAPSAALRARAGHHRAGSRRSPSSRFGESSERVGGHAVLSDGTAVFVPLGDAIDVGRECGRLGAEVERLGAAASARRRRSSATSSSSPGRRRTWWSASGRSWSAGRSSARCWCGSGSCWGADENSRACRGHRVPSAAVARARCRLRPHRAAAGRSARHRHRRT